MKETNIEHIRYITYIRLRRYSRRLKYFSVLKPKFHNSNFLVASSFNFLCELAVTHSLFTNNNEIALVLVVTFHYLGHSKNLCLLTYLLVHPRYTSDTPGFLVIVSDVLAISATRMLRGNCSRGI